MIALGIAAFQRDASLSDAIRHGVDLLEKLILGDNGNMHFSISRLTNYARTQNLFSYVECIAGTTGASNGEWPFPG